MYVFDKATVYNLCPKFYCLSLDKMKGSGALWSALLVLVVCYDSVTAQQTIKNDEDAKNFIKSFLYNSTNDVQRLGNNRDILRSNANNVAQNIANAKTNANNLARQTKSNIDNVVYIIDSAASVASTKSQACANTAVARKSKIINETNQQIEEALKALDQLKPAESEIAAISARLYANTVESRVTAMKNCVNNVVVTVNNVAQVAGCISNVINAFSNYINDESNKINTQYINVTSLVNPILNNLYSQFNNFISAADEKAKIEAEAILDCAGLSAQKRVESAIQRITTINAQVDSSLGNGTKDLLNAISNTKNTLNNNLANATKVINDLLTKVNNYGKFFSYLAPTNASAIQKQVDSVTNSSIEQLGRVKKIYDEVVADLNALNVSIPDIYNEYKKTYTAISSVNFTALISPNINERLNTGKLQTTLNDYISRLVDAANQATANVSAKISQYNQLIDKVNTVTSIRVNAEFVFAINVTKSIENIYFFGGIELRFSADKIFEQLNNSSQVVSIVNFQNQSNILYNQIKEQLNNATFISSLQSGLSPIINTINELLKNNPDLNSQEVKNIIDKIIEYATVRINGNINLSLQDLFNINLVISRVNISADLKALQEAIKNCFSNSDQYAAIVCSNKVVADFQNNNANALIELQQYYNNLIKLPGLVQSVINNITIDTVKSITDLYELLKNQTKPNKVGEFIVNLTIEKETNIDTKIKEIQNILNIIKDVYIKFGVNVSIDAYLAPYKNILDFLSNNFTRIDYSRFITNFPELKNQSLNDIKLILDNITLQAVSSIQTQINNIIIDLNSKFPTINAGTVNATCWQYAGTANYSICVDAKLQEFKQYIISVNSSLNNLTEIAVQINSSFNFNVSGIVQNELIKVYNLSVDKAVNILTITVNYLINNTISEINKNVDIVLNKINEYKNSLDNLILNLTTPIKTALDTVQQQYPNVNLDKYYKDLQTLIDNVKSQILVYLNLILQQVTTIKTTANNITIDIKGFELKLKNCLNSYGDINQVIQLCVVPAINDINIDIKVKYEILQKLLPQVFSYFPIDIQLKGGINIYTNIFNVNSTLIVDAAKQDANTTVYIQNVQNDIDSCVNLISAELAKLKLELQYLKQYGADYLSKLQAKIDEAVKPLVVAINATLSIYPNLNLTKEKDVLKKLVNDTINKVNLIVTSELNKYLAFIADSQKVFDDISNAYKNLVDDLKKFNLTVRCKRSSVSDQEFRNCVDNFYKNFQILCKNFTQSISDVRNKTINITRVVDLNINASVSIILNDLYNLSTSIGVDIYKNYNITGQNIIDYAMDLKTYNITPIVQAILQISAYGDELDRRNTFARSYGNNTLFTSGAAIYDIVGPGRAICGQKSVDAKLKKAQTLIAERTNYTLQNAPDLSSIIKSLFKLSNDTNDKLFYQISLLDETRLKQVCPLSYSEVGKQFEMYQCVINEVNKFGKYYDAEIINIKNYTKNSFDKLKEGSDALNQWRVDYVLVEAGSIIAQLEQESENFYRECNATAEKLINFSLFVATSHYNNFQQRIISNFTEINVIADRVISKNYSGYNITPKLEAASQVVLTAINAVLASNKSNLITSEVYLALRYLIQNSSVSFDNILANFTLQSVLYKKVAASLIDKREEIQKSINYTYLYNRCYDDSSPFPLTDLAACDNNQTYTNVFLIGNNRTWTSLLAIKQDLINFDVNSQQIIKDGADWVEKDFKKSAIFFAYRLYKMAGMPVPPEIASQVEENRCIQGVTTNKYYCVVTT